MNMFFPILLSLYTFGITVDAENEAPCVTTDQGKLCGFTETFNSKELALFYGVPFAKRPIKDTRFLPPTAAEPYTNGTFNATTLAPYCVQPNGSVIIGQMDCLYMNIYAPAIALQPNRSASLPVMFWIHGGGFTQGAASIYDSRELSSFGDVIVVTTNYRLGIFGFGYLSATDMVGNVGLLDQRMALQWVNNNIEAFGGNTKQITIFGESAGAASVSAHLFAPESLKLFRNAIIESGSVLCEWGMHSGDYLAQITTQIAEFAECRNATSAQTFECIGTKTADELIAAYNTYYSFNESIFQFLSSLEEDKLFFNGNSRTADIDYEGHSIMVGTNGDEGASFLSAFLPQVFKDYDALTWNKYFDYYAPQVLEYMVGLTLPTPQSAVANYYAPPRNANYFDAIVQLISDFFIRCCGGHDILAVFRRTADGSYSYLFNHTTDYTKMLHEWGSYHSSELMFVFGGTLYDPRATNAEKALSQKIMAYWTNFAKNNMPTSDTVEWPALTKQLDATIDYKVLDVGNPPVAPGLKQQECTFWRSIYPFMPKNRRNFVY